MDLLKPYFSAGSQVSALCPKESRWTRALISTDLTKIICSAAQATAKFGLFVIMNTRPRQFAALDATHQNLVNRVVTKLLFCLLLVCCLRSLKPDIVVHSVCLRPS